MDMVEKVARAIFRTGFHPDDDNSLVEEKWSEWPDEQARARVKARAAIAAMREPTEGMVEAADAAMRMKVAEGPKRLETLRHGYMAAIAAAIGEA